MFFIGKSIIYGFIYYVNRQTYMYFVQVYFMLSHRKFTRKDETIGETRHGGKGSS